MKQALVKDKLYYTISVALFVFFVLWWMYLKTFSLDEVRNARQLWGALYQIVALLGGILGISISYKWGGHKSILGRAILAFSIGLFLQCFGQTYSSYYVFHYKVESPPYPGIGDIGFFGSIFLYIYGVVLLFKLGSSSMLLKKIQNQLLILIVPVVMLIGSYFFFLKGYEFDWTNKLKIFLDFGYPFGQAFYVSVAILTLFLSRNILGGVMKKPLMLLLFALLFQYFSDFFFLYQSNFGTWHVAGINDLMYFISYFIMTLSIIQLGTTFNKVKKL